MAAGTPIIQDNKWYTQEEAYDREDYLQQNASTGEQWYWVNRQGQQVVFGRVNQVKEKDNELPKM